MKWIEKRYGGQSLILGNWLKLYVTWDGANGYSFIAWVGDIKLKQKFLEMDDAKKAALKFAKKLINQAMKDLK